MAFFVVACACAIVVSVDRPLSARVDVTLPETAAAPTTAVVIAPAGPAPGLVQGVELGGGIATVAPEDRPVVIVLPPTATPTPLPPTPTRYPPAVTAPCSDPAVQTVDEVRPPGRIPAQLRLRVVLPPCYDPKKFEYPVVYLLPGNEFDFGLWSLVGLTETLNTLIAAGQLPPFIAVELDNDVGLGDRSIFNNSSRGPASYEGYVIDDLIPYVESKYSVWRSRDGRAVGGISRGGYWAIQLAFAHPNLFGAVGGHSPVISSDYLDGVPENFTMIDQAQSVAALKTLRIWLDAGAEDAGAHGAGELSIALDKVGIKNQMNIPDGGHNVRYWSAHLIDYLNFYALRWPAQPRKRGQG